jgi:hypothetical protein
MKTSTFVTLFLCLLISTAIGNPGDTLWTRTYGGSEIDNANCIQQTADGGYIMGGKHYFTPPRHSNLYLVKTDADGDTLWTRSYGNSFERDEAWSVQQTSDGGYIVTGNTRSFGAGGYDVWLLKTDANGDTLWTRTYGGSGTDYGHSVEQTPDGGYMIGGKTTSFGAGSYDVWLLKTDANGDTLWTRTYGGSRIDQALDAHQTSDGGYVLVGYTESFGAGSADFYVVKTDANGDTIWTRVYGGELRDECQSIRETADGGYFLAGYSRSFGASDELNIYLVKTDANGDTLWTRTYGGVEDDWTYDGQQTPDGGYFIAGTSYSFGPGLYDFWLLKCDANGDTLWSRLYGGGESDDARAFQLTSDGAYAICGYTESYGAGSQDIWLVKVEGEAPEPDIAIGMIPDITPPIVLPAGSNFVYEGTLTNNTNGDLYTDVWIKACYIPNGSYHGPYKTYYDLLVPANSTRSYYPVRQHIPGFAAPADYNYIAYCGEWPENNIIDSTFFMITVTAADGNAGPYGWDVYGWGGADTPEIPVDLALYGNYPNPFNATTNISFGLPEAGHVSLEIYNLMGQKVATLVDGNMPAGSHSVCWDASTASSGIYFYKLTTADFTETKRMTLLK